MCKDEEDERAAIGGDLHDLPWPRTVALLPGEAPLLPHPPPSVRSVFRGRILGRNPVLPTYEMTRWDETRGRILLDEIQKKVLRVFLLAIQSHHYSFALWFLFLQTHATSYRFNSALLYTVQEKGGKPDRKPHLLPYGLRNPYRNLSLRTLKIMLRNLASGFISSHHFMSRKHCCYDIIS